ncbi:MAG: hypothetical protein AAGK79_17345 [Pseudomonadota bacterium]
MTTDQKKQIASVRRRWILLEGDTTPNMIVANLIQEGWARAAVEAVAEEMGR